VREIGRTAVRLARCAVDVETGPLSIPLGAPSTFGIPVGAARAVSFAELGFAQVHELKDRLGVTVNDVVLAICSGALRATLSEHEQESHHPLVAIVPVSVRGQSVAGDLGNRLSAMFVALANDLPRPLDRLRAIAAASASAKAQERTVGYGPMASAVTEALPPAVAQPLVRLGIRAGALRRLRAGNLMVSNVPGPDFPLFFAGMRMLSAHPLGPVVDGVALNITVQRYCDSLFVGVNACSSVVPNLPALTRSMVDELGRLLEAAGGDGVAAGSRGTGLRLPWADPAHAAHRRSMIAPAGKAG
jgi:WS/DGAT/MGAT family acyltransferase